MKYQTRGRTLPGTERKFGMAVKYVFVLGGVVSGLGIRLDIKFAVLRLDWGIQLHNPNNPAGKRWIHDFKWSNTALNFGVGYPF